MEEKIIIAGAGGQGIMLLGKVLAAAAVKENKHVTWLPCYGAEVRGGAAYCMVIISDAEISSPYIKKADTLLVMNAPSLAGFKNRLVSKGLMLINSSLARDRVKVDARVARFPFSEIASEVVGNIKTANIVALGCLLSHKKIVRPDSVNKVIKEMAPKKELAVINLRALEEGMHLR